MRERPSLGNISTRFSLREKLIVLLADGEFHSGEHLARGLGVSRAAVWKALNGLEDLGIELHRETETA